MAAPLGIIDTRVLGKPTPYSNQKPEWPEFQFTLKSYVGAISQQMLGMMLQAETMEGPIRLETLTPEEQVLSRTLMYLLSGVLQGSAKRLLMNTQSNNGMEAYRMLCKREDPSSGSVQVAHLSNILKMQFSGKLEQFEEEVEKFEAAVKRYEQTYSEVISDALQQSILKTNCPSVIKQQVEIQSFPNYATLRSTLVEYVTSRTIVSSTPMDVGAIDQKGKGKGKKGKGKTKDKGKKGKGKTGHYSSSGIVNTNFQGHCNYCGKWGHKKSECRNRTKPMEEGAVDASSSAQAWAAGRPTAAGSPTTPKVNGAIDRADSEEREWIY